jgi:hypothetical protein
MRSAGRISADRHVHTHNSGEEQDANDREPMSHDNPEFRLHAHCVRYLERVTPDCFIFHPANGEKRSEATGRKLKAMGVRKGVFDLVLLTPDTRAFFIEFKSEKGELKDEQESFRIWLITAGFQYAVVRSQDDLRDFILQNSIPNRLSEQAARLVAA